MPGRRELAGHVAGLAHAAADDPAAAGQDRPAGGRKRPVDAPGDGRQAIGLDREHATPAGGEIEVIGVGGLGH